MFLSRCSCLRRGPLALCGRQRPRARLQPVHAPRPEPAKQPAACSHAHKVTNSVVLALNREGAGIGHLGVGSVLDPARARGRRVRRQARLCEAGMRSPALSSAASAPAGVLAAHPPPPPPPPAPCLGPAGPRSATGAAARTHLRTPSGSTNLSKRSGAFMALGRAACCGCASERDKGAAGGAAAPLALRSSSGPRTWRGRLPRPPPWLLPARPQTLLLRVQPPAPPSASPAPPCQLRGGAMGRRLHSPAARPLAQTRGSRCCRPACAVDQVGTGSQEPARGEGAASSCCGGVLCWAAKAPPASSLTGSPSDGWAARPSRRLRQARAPLR